MKKLIILLLLVSITYIAYGADDIDNEPVIATVKVWDFVNVNIQDEIKTVSISTEYIYKDAIGDTVNRERAEELNFVSADYVSFMQELGLTRSKVRQAIKNRL